MDCSPSGSSVHGILQARILEWVSTPPRDLPKPGIESRSPTLQADSLPSEPPWKPMSTGVGSLSLLQGKKLSNPGIEPGTPASQTDSLPAEPQGKPKSTGVGSLSLLQGIFLTQQLNQGLLLCRRILYQLSHRGRPCEVLGGARFIKTESRVVVAGAGFRVSVPQEQTRSRGGW